MHLPRESRPRHQMAGLMCLPSIAMGNHHLVATCNFEPQQWAVMNVDGQRKTSVGSKSFCEATVLTGG